jgi:ATP-dependent exoDNAse (exonuclease V) alpha subunit
MGAKHAAAEVAAHAAKLSGKGGGNDRDGDVVMETETTTTSTDAGATTTAAAADGSIGVSTFAAVRLRDRVVPRNKVRYTPVQVEAIKSALQPGLTVVVGPPGTGKTDVAVQAIAELMHNCPQQRLLLVTHSNQVSRRFKHFHKLHCVFPL